MSVCANDTRNLAATDRIKNCGLIMGGIYDEYFEVVADQVNIVIDVPCPTVERKCSASNNVFDAR